VFTACSDSSGDGGPAFTARFAELTDIEAGPDGSLLLVERRAARVRAIDRNGQVKTVLSGGSTYLETYYGWFDLCKWGTPFSLDHVDTLGWPAGVAVAPDGDLFVTDPANRHVYALEGPGEAWTLMGGGGVQDALSPWAPRSLALARPEGIALAPDGTLYVTDSGFATGVDQDRIIRIAPPRPLWKDQYEVPSKAGDVLWVFDHDGRHLETKDAATDETLVSFAYDEGRLAAVDVPGSGRTALSYAGDHVDITGPYGQTTRAWIGEDGLVSRIASGPDLDAATGAVSVDLEYSSDRLLKRLVDERGQVHVFDYDDVGRLLRDIGPSGEQKGLTTLGPGAVSVVTAEGRATQYDVSQLPGGQVSRTVLHGAGEATLAVTSALDYSESAVGGRRQRVNYPDGSVRTVHLGADARFGAKVPVVERVTVETGGEAGPRLVSTTAIDEGWCNVPDAREADLCAGETDRVYRRETTLGGGATPRTWTLTTNLDVGQTTLVPPSGTRVTTITMAPAGACARRISRIEQTGRATTQVGWEAVPGANGGMSCRVHTLTVSPDPPDPDYPPRTYEFDYEPGPGYATGLPSTSTGPDGRATTVEYDALARVQAVSWGEPGHLERPEANFAHDDEGDLVSLWPPEHQPPDSDDAHSFEHDASGRVTVYEPPAISGGATTTRYQYNKDGDPVAVFLPDGTAVRLTYDTLGRLERMQTPEWEQLLEYDGAGRLVDVEGSPSGFANRMSFVHNGALLVSQSWSGTVEGSVVFGAFDDQLTPRESCVGAAANGICEDGTAVDVDRDQDGLVERVGDLDLALDPDRGLVTGATLGQVATTFGYNPFWELTATATTSGGVPLLACELERDALGRIVQREETVGSGAPEVRCFFYDVAGRLARVATGTDCGGALTDIATYGYDRNGNPTSVMEHGTTLTAAAGDMVVDRQDRLLRYGDACFEYNPRGQLRRRYTCDAPEGASNWNDYDALGGLKSVRSAAGATVHYELDPLGRRIGRREDGVWTARYLYGDSIQVVAQLTPALPCVGPAAPVAARGRDRVAGDGLRRPRPGPGGARAGCARGRAQVLQQAAVRVVDDEAQRLVVAGVHEGEAHDVLAAAGHAVAELVHQQAGDALLAAVGGDHVALDADVALALLQVDQAAHHVVAVVQEHQVVVLGQEVEVQLGLHEEAAQAADLLGGRGVADAQRAAVGVRERDDQVGVDERALLDAHQAGRGGVLQVRVGHAGQEELLLGALRRLLLETRDAAQQVLGRQALLPLGLGQPVQVTGQRLLRLDEDRLAEEAHAQLGVALLQRGQAVGRP
jgi:YD repeat-containing protein